MTLKPGRTARAWSGRSGDRTGPPGRRPGSTRKPSTNSGMISGPAIGSRGSSRDRAGRRSTASASAVPAVTLAPDRNREGGGGGVLDGDPAAGRGQLARPIPVSPSAAAIRPRDSSGTTTSAAISAATSRAAATAAAAHRVGRPGLPGPDCGGHRASCPEDGLLLLQDLLLLGRTGRTSQDRPRWRPPGAADAKRYRAAPAASRSCRSRSARPGTGRNAGRPGRRCSWRRRRHTVSAMGLYSEIAPSDGQSMTTREPCGARRADLKGPG